ncbi:MAG: 3'(2'),5'-bisphosphate nucleotidase CysQ [Pseudomonadota bacterium]
MPGSKSDLPTPAEELKALVSAAKETGREIMPLFKDCALKVWEKGDRSPVTEADLRANNVLREILLSGIREDYGWLSEESADDPDRLAKARTLIIDPIDGTRAFLRGDDRFTVCLAITEGERALASVIYAPARGELYAASAGGGATLNGASLASSKAEDIEGAKMLAYARMFDHPAWPQPWPPMQVDYTNSTSYRIALVAAGQYDAAIALAKKADWDVAPGALIAEEAGAAIGDHLGRPFVFGQEIPSQPGLVCAASSLYPRLLGRLSHLPDNLDQLRV